MSYKYIFWDQYMYICTYDMFHFQTLLYMVDEDYVCMLKWPEQWPFIQG
jgi:hypothetical protein